MSKRTVLTGGGRYVLTIGCPACPSPNIVPDSRSMLNETIALALAPMIAWFNAVCQSSGPTSDQQDGRAAPSERPRDLSCWNVFESVGHLPDVPPSGLLQSVNPKQVPGQLVPGRQALADCYRCAGPHPKRVPTGFFGKQRDNIVKGDAAQRRCQWRARQPKRDLLRGAREGQVIRLAAAFPGSNLREAIHNPRS